MSSLMFVLSPSLRKVTQTQTVLWSFSWSIVIDLFLYALRQFEREKCLVLPTHCHPLPNHQFFTDYSWALWYSDWTLSRPAFGHDRFRADILSCALWLFWYRLTTLTLLLSLCLEMKPKVLTAWRVRIASFTTWFNLFFMLHGWCGASVPGFHPITFSWSFWVLGSFRTSRVTGHRVLLLKPTLMMGFFFLLLLLLLLLFIF